MVLCMTDDVSTSLLNTICEYVLRMDKKNDTYVNSVWDENKKGNIYALFITVLSSHFFLDLTRDDVEEKQKIHMTQN